MPIPHEQLPPTDRMDTEQDTQTTLPIPQPPPAPKRPPLSTLRKPSAMPAKSNGTPPPPTQSARAQVTFGKLEAKPHGHRIVIYGPGGIGKTTLCAQLPGPVAFYDLEHSLQALRLNLEEQGLIDNIVPVEGAETWSDIRATLHGNGWAGIKTIVMDSATKAEELATAHVLANIKVGKGETADSIEAYGYGKGYIHQFETFINLLGDLDRHSLEGRNVVLVCHDCTASVPNPHGEDWLRYEPRLQNSAKSSIRLRVREWADHVLFVGYDVSVNKDGKGVGGGTRTVYTSELPHCMAKSRSTGEQIPLDGEEFWSRIIR